MLVSRRGVAAVLLSNVLFGVLYLYSHFMQPMVGSDVFAWRMVAMLVALSVMMSMGGGWVALREFVSRINQQPWQWLLFVGSTFVVGGNLWVFMWAPVNGYGIDVAVGYFLLPLTTLLMGMVVFGERLNKWQKWAVAFAGVGVMHEMWAAESLSWITLFCCLSYPFYFGIRRHLQTPALVGLWMDLMLIAPFAIAYLVFFSDSMTLVMSQWHFTPLIISLGVFSALAMCWVLYGARTLPFTLFSMLTYGEPILLFVLAVVFMNAPLTGSAMITYGFVWVGLMLMVWDGCLQMRQQRDDKAVSEASTSASSS